jgi:hypothetical protein
MKDQKLMMGIVGYDTAVIGGTMALDSFRRDFGINIPQTQRDTIQGNIVSTFQVRVDSPVKYTCSLMSIGRPVAFLAHSSPFHLRRSSVERKL